MMPISHFLIGWVTANAAHVGRRDRVLVTLAGVVPDVDGLGIIAELATRNTTHPLYWWTRYHHVLAHNILFALLTAAICFAIAKRKLRTALFGLLSFHLHLLGDLVGARGPDDYQWPIPYLLPFSDRWQWTWEGQWLLTAWQNVVITGFALALTLYLAWRRSYSPLEMFSSRADTVLVRTLQNRFRSPTEQRNSVGAFCN